MTSSTALVRAIEVADYDRWLDLWTGYNAFYGRAGAGALSLEITQSTWSRFFNPAEPVWALVAERDGAVVGIVHYLFHRSTILLAPACYLQDLFTSPEARNTGVGRALIEAVYERAALAGSPGVYWHTQATNEAARRLYEVVARDTGFLVYRKVF